jgi:hypothetical protein
MAILDGRLPRRAGVHRVVANPVLWPFFSAPTGSLFSPLGSPLLLGQW